MSLTNGSATLYMRTVVDTRQSRTWHTKWLKSLRTASGQSSRGQNSTVHCNTGQYRTSHYTLVQCVKIKILMSEYKYKLIWVDFLANTNTNRFGSNFFDEHKYIWLYRANMNTNTCICTVICKYKYKYEHLPQTKPKINMLMYI